MMWALTFVTAAIVLSLTVYIGHLSFDSWKEEGVISHALQDGWTLTNSNLSIAVPARLPATVHGTLMDSRIIDNPSFRYNELTTRWVGEEQEWTFRFDVASDDYVRRMLQMHAGDELTFLLLRFGSNTGYCVVTFGGEVVSALENELIHHELLVHKHRVVACLERIAKGAVCELCVALSPPLKTARVLALQSAYDIPAIAFYNDWAEPTHRNFLRKASSDFGWDWGPALMPVGVGDVELVLVSSRVDSMTMGHLGEIVIKQQHGDDDSLAVTLAVTVDVVSFQEGTVPAAMIFTLCGPDGHVVVQASQPCTSSQVSEELVVTEPAFWFPIHYGEQPLYSIAVSFRGQLLTRKLGLRRVELVRNATADGETFFFRVNGVAVFAKGANVIPPTALPDRLTINFLAKMVDSALAANFNMLRVWGGGGRFPMAFYDMCDSRGLLLWQELNYACALYPATADFLESAWTETTSIVRDLHHHPAIAIWGGNNEVQQSLTWLGRFGKSQLNNKARTPLPPGLRRAYEEDYEKLFVGTIQKAVKVVAAEVPFVHSSPANGDFVADEDANDLRRGDVHYYNYGVDCEDHEAYPLGRFISEHGVQSYPSMASFSAVSDPADRTPDSPLLAFRLRHEHGLEEMANQMRRHFSWSETQPFAMYLHLSQVQQGRCLSEAIGVWRRNSRPDGGGTMGILYWQLNDVWAAPSWSTLEADGAWKASHFAVKRAFQPVLASVTRAREGTVQKLDFHVSADWSLSSGHATAAGSLAIPMSVKYKAGMYRWAQVAPECSPVEEWEGEFVITSAGSSLVVLSVDVPQEQASPGEAYIHFSVESVGEEASTSSTTIVVLSNGPGESPNSLKDVKLLKPDIAVVQAARVDALGSEVELVLQAAATAPHVWLELQGSARRGRLSDNDLFMLPCERRRVTLDGVEPTVSIDALLKDVNIFSLYDMQGDHDVIQPDRQ